MPLLGALRVKVLCASEQASWALQGHKLLVDCCVVPRSLVNAYYTNASCLSALALEFSEDLLCL